MKSAKEVAGDLGVSVETVYKLLRAGEIPSSVVRGQWRISERELIAYLHPRTPNHRARGRAVLSRQI